MIDLDWLLINGRNPRVHGNGFLQIDLEIDGEIGGERVHIFGHPALPRQTTPTPIHDHRFGFDSRVRKGRLVNVTYDLAGTGPATHDVYAPSPRVGEDTALLRTGEQGRLAVRQVDVVLPGERYSIGPRVFHETLTNEVTITHMAKSCTTSYLPRVLVPVGCEPDNDFTRYDLDETALWQIVREAFA